MANIYTIHNVTINGTALAGITRQSLGRGITTLIQGGSGAVDPTFGVKLQEAPTAEWDTVHIATALTAVGISGVAISPSVIVAFQKKADGGTRASGSSHTTATLNDGLVVPVRLAAQHGQEATLTMMAYAVGTSPITLSTAAALSGNQTVDEKFTAGPVVINGTTYQTQSIDIDFGIKVNVKGHSGNINPSFGGIDFREPVIRIQSNDLAAANLDGTITSGIVYLRNLATPASASSVHVKFTCTGGLYHTDSAEGTHDGDASATVMLKPIWDETNAILQIATSQAIT